MTMPFTGMAQTWMNGFSYRKKITIDKTKVIAKVIAYSQTNIVYYDLIDFPVLVELTDKDLIFKNGACGNRIQNVEGKDITFALSTAPTLPLSFQLDSYNPVTGKLSCWVRISILSANKTTTPATSIYLYYGGTVLHDPMSVAALQTWSTDYSKVWHMGSTTSEAGLQQISASAVTNASFTSGKIEKAISFNGQLDDYRGGNLNNTTLTISAWIKPKTMGSEQVILTNDSALMGGFQLKLNAAGKLVLQTFNTISPPIVLSSGPIIQANGQWHHIWATMTSGSTSLFINNAPAASSVNSALKLGSGGSVVIGASKQHDRHFNGEIDELRIQNIMAPLEWLNTQYANQNNPASFIVVSAEEYNPAGFSRYTGSNGQWNVAGNWAGNAIPQANSNILIAAGKKTAVTGTMLFNKLVVEQGASLEVSGTLTCGCSVNIESAGEIKINDGGKLKLEGQVRNNGQINAIGSTAIVTFSGNQPVQEYSGTGTMIISNLENDQTEKENSLTLHAKIEVSRLVTLKKGNLEANLNLVFLAASQIYTASLSTVNASIASINGDVIVQQYISGSYPTPSTGRGWRLLSSPVSNGGIPEQGTYNLQSYKDAIFVTGNADATKGFDPSPQNGGTIYTHDQSLPGTLSQKYIAIKNISQPIEIGRGIYVFSRGSRLEPNAAENQMISQPFINPKPYLINHIGKLFNGTLKLALTNNDLGNPGDGFNLIGNPYASNVQWGMITTEHTTPFIWQFDPLNNAYVVQDAYTTIIPAGTAFFVRVSSGNKTGSLTFTEGAKYSNATPSLPVLQSLRASSALTNEGSGTMKVVLSKGQFAQSYIFKLSDHGVDGLTDQDAPKIGEGFVSICSTVDGQKISIDDRALLSGTKLINLSVSGTESGLYQLNFTSTFNNKIKTKLLDHYLDTEYEITASNGSYQFTIDKTLSASQGTGRFSILITEQDALEVVESQINIFPNPFNDHFSIIPAKNSSDRLEFTITDLAGRVLMKNQIDPDNNTLIVNTQHLSKGFYILILVNTKTKKRLITRKLIKI